MLEAEKLFEGSCFIGIADITFGLKNSIVILRFLS